jgi:hypothetical protein
MRKIFYIYEHKFLFDKFPLVFVTRKYDFFTLQGFDEIIQTQSEGFHRR